MGMTRNQIAMIRALANNRISEAKKYAIACCVEDKTKKNEREVTTCKNLLEHGGANMIALPATLQNILIMEDVSGFKEERYFLGEREQQVFENIKRANRVSMKLLELGIPYLNSTLLYGRPGTGKTMFGRYVAYKLGLPFVYVNFSYLIESYMGHTSRNIKKIFDYCKGKQLVLMLDEIDCIGLRRENDGSGTAGELARTTISLMQELDEMTNEQIIIGATNREDRLDPALKRRFYQRKELVPYNPTDNLKMATQFLEDVGIAYEQADLEKYLEGDRTQADVIQFATRLVIEQVAKEMEGEGNFLD